MSDPNHGTPPPEDSVVQELVELLKRSHKNPTNDVLQQEAIQSSVNFIHKSDDIHLFCNRAMNPAATHALILFSFAGDSPALDWLKGRAAESLDNCASCISMFQRSRVKLKETFMRDRGVPAESVQDFSDLVLAWESTRLFTKLSSSLESYKSSLQTNSRPPIPDQLIMGFIECIAGPHMLRLNADLRTLFNEVLRVLLKREHEVATKTVALSPGYLFLTYEGDDMARKWAFRMLDRLYDPKTPLTSSQIHNDVVEEFEFQLKDVQKNQNKQGSDVDDHARQRFYRSIYPLFKLADTKAILEWLAHFARPRSIDLDSDQREQIQLDILLLLRDDLLSYPDQSLPFVLRFLELILKRVGAKFWGEIGEFTFQNIMGCIIRNPNFIKHLCLLKDIKPMSGELDPMARLSDLMEWIAPFLDSLNQSQRIKSVETMSLQFIGILENEMSISLDVKSILFTKSCDMLSKILAIPSQLYTHSLNTDLLARSDARVVVNTKLVRFFDYATYAAIFFPEDERLRNAAVGRIATIVITSALRFDILTFAQNSYEIHRGQKPSTLRYSPQLFQCILKQGFGRQLELCFQVLCALDNVSTIIPVGSPAHISEVTQFLKYLSEFLTKLNDVDAKHIQKMLSNSKSLRGYWACVFSPDEGVYQSATDVIYEAFDANGRLEAVQSLLSNNLEAGIDAINDNLTNLIFIEFYEPCPRAVKVLTDVIQALNSPVDGLFSAHDTFNTATRAVLVTFWNRCWKFLDLIYINTIKWADKYPDLVEFTRDTLDLSHAVLGCFRTIRDVFQEADSASVFNEITNTFEHMLVWLRLSDPGLLSSCVKLISSTVDLATDLNYRLSPNVVDLLSRYGAKSKGFNNKLTESQTEEILGRARVFDPETVDKIVSEAEAHRRAKLGITEPPSSSSSRSVTPVPRPESSGLSSSNISSMTAPRLKGQMKIGNFASLARGPPVAPGKKVLPLSAMELARQKLNAKKKEMSTHRQRREETSDDNDSDDDTTEDAHVLFNVPKPKRPKPTLEKAGITLLGDWSKPKRTNIDEKKREEEYSRLRLSVDMKPLYRKILKWSFARVDDYPDSELNNLTPVSDKFSSAEEYQRIYEPLLLVECWQALSTARTREDFKPLNINVGSKSSVDEFFEVFCSLTKAEISERGITDSDLVVLALASQNKENPTVKDIKSSKMTCLAKIHEIKFLKGDRVDLTLRVTRSATLNQWLSPQMPILLMRIMQMTTIEREYSSLMGLKYYNLADQILKAQPNPPASVSSSLIETISKRYQVNESQAKAIGVSVATEGFSLIQGPPGTGKTKTILGIIGHMLSSFRATNAIAVPGQPISSEKTRKVLVCAPSNAAVDELVIRLKDGIMNSKGEKYVPKLVRLGRSDAVNVSVKDVTLEELVDRQLGKSDPIGSNTDSLFKELNEFRKQLDECKTLIADEKKPAGNEVYDKKRMLTSQINNVKKKLDQERERQNSAYRNREITRRNCQAKILGDAEIICSTLSGSAHDMVASLGIKFDSVIVDEACQCTELSVVIPLRYGCKRCVMVGDPNQLPPTVLSSAASNCNYDQSLFVRMAKATKPLLLNVQYRMNPEISMFPSKKFYNGELKDGPQNDSLTARAWHESKLFPPYKFYDISEGQQSQNKKTFSYTNRAEVDIAIEMVRKLFREYVHMDFKNKIGIITPYKEQNQLLRSSFMKEFGKPVLSEISFNTIDGFQGQEKEIIIMSCVRADPSAHGVGFLRDFRRMNVALTRPKCSLWILGHHDSLVKNNLWKDLINDAKERDCLSVATRGFTHGAQQNRAPFKRETQKPVRERNTPVSNSRPAPIPTNSGSVPKPSTKQSTSSLQSGVAATALSSTHVTPSNGTPYVPAEGTPVDPRRPSNTSLKTEPSSSRNAGKGDEKTASGTSSSLKGNLNHLPTGPSEANRQYNNNGSLPSGPSSMARPSNDHALPSGPASHNRYLNGQILPSGPSSIRSGTLPPQPRYPQPSNSGTLPAPRPSNSGVIPPRTENKRPKEPPSMFIRKRRRH